MFVAFSVSSHSSRMENVEINIEDNSLKNNMTITCLAIAAIALVAAAIAFIPLMTIGVPLAFAASVAPMVGTIAGMIAGLIAYFCFQPGVRDSNSNPVTSHTDNFDTNARDTQYDAAIRAQQSALMEAN